MPRRLVRVSKPAIPRAAVPPTRLSARFIEEFNFKYVASQHLDYSPDLTSDQTFCGFIFEERDDIQQFDRHVLHVRFIARNKLVSFIKTSGKTSRIPSPFAPTKNLSSSRCGHSAPSAFYFQKAPALCECFWPAHEPNIP